MDAITAARELGRAIQSDERYVAYLKAKEANDKDAELQQNIDAFDRVRQLLQVEMQKEESEKDSEKLQSINKEMQETYSKVMKNENMANFVIAKNALDLMLGEVNAIISMCCEGADPDTCEPPQTGCSGSCESCGGCH